MPERPPASFTQLIQVSVLLFLLSLLPFLEILGAWFYWSKCCFLLVTLMLGLWVLPRASLEWRVSWPPLALATWILFEVIRAPEWDRSFGLLGAWGCALVLGLVARTVSRSIPGFPWAFCLLLWGLSTVIAVMNPVWTVPVEVMEESLQGNLYDEGYKQAILHAASQNRYHFPFGNPIDLGVFLCLSLLSFPVLLERAWRSLSARVFVLGVLVSMGAQILVLWGTRSRTSLVGLLAGICVWMAWKGKSGARLVLAGLLLMAIGATVLCLSPAGREMLSRTETVHARLVFWKAGLRMAHENPLLGLGIGGYGSHYPRFRELTTHQTVFAHNLLIEAMADMGAVGLGLLLTVLFQFASRTCRSWKETPFEVWRASALVTFFISTLLGFHQDMLYLIGFVGVIVGLGPGAQLLTQLRETHEREPRPGGMHPQEVPQLEVRRIISPLQSGRLLRQCLVVVILLAVGIPCVFREAGQALFEEGTDIFDTQRDVVKTKLLLDRAITLWPPLAEAHSYLGGLMIDIGDIPAAEDHIRTAIHWSPTAGFLHDDLAELLARSGRQEEALREIDRAIALHPVKYTYYLHRSRLLYGLGQTAEAAQTRARGDYLQQFEPRYDEARKAQASREKE